MKWAVVPDGNAETTNYDSLRLGTSSNRLKGPAELKNENCVAVTKKRVSHCDKVLASGFAFEYGYLNK
ncbi:hypothetical protein GCM10011297_33080 [Bacterioplanes sanyensis]|nr:hypothetical protein GCM10011297_33080 [Bacterioplanes sanyensis]